MKSKLILVTGMAGVGKSTLTGLLSKGLKIPFVSYDNIVSKEWELLSKNEKMKEMGITKLLSYDFFWFNIEEIMKSGSHLAADYFFHPMQIPLLDELIHKYDYEPITIIVDAKIETAYKRFIARNNNPDRPEAIRIDISLDDFSKSSKVNKEFRYGSLNIVVDTESFDKINGSGDYDASSFDDVIKLIRENI